MKFHTVHVCTEFQDGPLFFFCKREGVVGPFFWEGGGGHEFFSSPVLVIRLSMIFFGWAITVLWKFCF